MDSPHRWPAPTRLYVRLTLSMADALRDAAGRNLRTQRDQATAYIVRGLQADGYLPEMAHALEPVATNDGQDR